LIESYESAFDLLCNELHGPNGGSMDKVKQNKKSLIDPLTFQNDFSELTINISKWYKERTKKIEEIKKETAAIAEENKNKL
jgi:hypothetical protein